MTFQMLEQSKLLNVSHFLMEYRTMISNRSVLYPQPDPASGHRLYFFGGWAQWTVRMNTRPFRELFELGFAHVLSMRREEWEEVGWEGYCRGQGRHD